MRPDPDSGFCIAPPDAASLAWCDAALPVARTVSADPQVQARHLRHGGTWFVGVDALPTDPKGGIAGVALNIAWRADLPKTRPWHPAQLSIVYPGYPGRDPGERDAAHRYRVNRAAAHVDGLLPIGPDRRRFPREFHAFVLGLALTDSDMAPTVCWPGSHLIVARALRAAIGDRDPSAVDVTEAYHAARREVFDTCDCVRLALPRGGAFLLHRFLLHGTAPWTGPDTSPDGRMIAFFRPEFECARAWIDKG